MTNINASSPSCNVMNFRPLTEEERRQLPPRSEWEEYGELYLLPDHHAAKHFLAVLDPSAINKFTFQTFDDNPERRKQRAKNREPDPLASVRHGSLHKWWDTLCRRNAEGAGIYVTVNETDGQGRTEKNIGRVRAVFVDLDGAPLPTTFHAKPHVVIESSPGRWHLYWRVKNFPLSQFTPLQTRLAAHYGGDPKICDLPRVMRLPGFFHCKGAPFRSRLVEVHDHDAYTVEQVTVGLPVEAKKEAKAQDNGRGNHHAGGEAYDDSPFRQLNSYALEHLDKWVPELFPTANKSNQGWRVSSASIDRDLEEDISFTPNGIVDFGIGDMGDTNEGGRTPIDIVMEWQKCDVKNAARWLHDKLGLLPPKFEPPKQKEQPKPAVLVPQPYVCKDPKTLPRREWLYGHCLIRKFVSMDVAPGGTGKSNQSLVEACAMASGKNLLGVAPAGRLRVWYFNLEDPQEELDRRIEAIRIQYNLKPEDLDGYLFVNGRGTDLVIGEADRNGPRIIKPVVNALIGAIKETHIDVVMVDPWVSTHRMNENDNMAMDMIAKEWSRVADEGNCAVRLTHHTRKGDAEVTSDSGRGAAASRDAGRIYRVFNRMTKEEAIKAGVEGEKRRRYFRTYIDKQNLAPPAEASDWFYLESVYLDNSPTRNINPFDRGDDVGVSTPWVWPDDPARVTQLDLDKCRAVIRGGSWRADTRSDDWVGHAIASALGLNLSKPTDDHRVKAIIEKWLKEGALEVVERKDEHRKKRKYVEAPEPPPQGAHSGGDGAPYVTSPWEDD
jgi:AAA domain/RepB DNA-primase N-terminal domain